MFIKFIWVSDDDKGKCLCVYVYQTCSHTPQPHEVSGVDDRPQQQQPMALHPHTGRSPSPGLNSSDCGWHSPEPWGAKRSLHRCYGDAGRAGQCLQLREEGFSNVGQLVLWHTTMNISSSINVIKAASSVDGPKPSVQKPPRWHQENSPQRAHAFTVTLWRSEFKGYSNERVTL